MSEFASDNFFTNELYQYYQRQGKNLSSKLFQTIDKPLLELSDEERETYEKYIVPSSQVIKQALASRYEQGGFPYEEWNEHLAHCNQSIIGMLASEVLGEMVTTPVETPVEKKEVPIATPVEAPMKKKEISEQEAIQNIQMNFFTNQYYEYCVSKGMQVSASFLSILNKSTLTEEEEEYYTNKVVPYKQNIKQALSEQFAKSGSTGLAWKSTLMGCSGTVIDRIVKEMFDEGAFSRERKDKVEGFFTGIKIPRQSDKKKPGKFRVVSFCISIVLIACSIWFFYNGGEPVFHFSSNAAPQIQYSWVCTQETVVGGNVAWELTLTNLGPGDVSPLQVNLDYGGMDVYSIEPKPLNWDVKTSPQFGTLKKNTSTTLTVNLVATKQGIAEGSASVKGYNISMSFKTIVR